MPLSIPPGFAHLALQFRHEADPEAWYTTFGVDTSGAGGDIEGIAEHAMNVFWATWGPYVSNQVDMTGCQVTLGQDGGLPIRALIGGSAYHGASTGAKLPQNCALLIAKNTSVGGRRNQGRMFLPGILDENDVNAVGVIANATRSTFQSTAATFLSQMGTAAVGDDIPLPMVLLHSTGNTPVPEPTVVTGLQVDGVISTQRRRLR